MTRNKEIKAALEGVADNVRISKDGTVTAKRGDRFHSAGGSAIMATLLLEEGERTCWLCGGEGEELDHMGETYGCVECGGKGELDERDNRDVDLDRSRAAMLVVQRMRGKNLRVTLNQLRNHRRLAETPRVILLPDVSIGITATLANLEHRNAPDTSTLLGLALSNARTQAKGWVL